MFDEHAWRVLLCRRFTDGNFRGSPPGGAALVGLGAGGPVCARHHRSACCVRTCRSWEPKSRAGRRTIALPGQLVEALKAHRATQLAERLRAGSEWRDHGLVFAQENGRPIDPRADYGAWLRLLAEAGVRRARLHDARHTAATLLLSQGVPARVAMDVLGHSAISLTLNTYSHVMPELQHDAAERVGAALWG